MKSSFYFDQLRDALITLAFPRACQLCGCSVESLANGAVCSACWAKTKVFDLTETLCHKCGRLLEHFGARQRELKTFCHRCDKDFYQVARAVGIYEGALRVAILELKEKPFVPLALLNLLVETFEKSPLRQATIILPVPLHAKRLSERGFNQAAVLARGLSRRVGLPIAENCLTRTIYTSQHRGAMDERARRESVEKSFCVQQPRLIENQKILLVDDVFTSGATVSACADVLKEKSAREVFVLTVARAF